MIESEAEPLANFLTCMLKWNPKYRPTAQQMLKHPWMKMKPNYNVFMSRSHAREWKRLNMPDEQSSTSSSSESEEVKKPAKKAGVEEDDDDEFTDDSQEEDESYESSEENSQKEYEVLSTY
jgi:serine/threonine protein kinase